MKELNKLSKEGKSFILSKLVLHAETMSEGRALGLGHTKEEYLIAQLVATRFLDSVKIAIEKLNTKK